MKKTFFASIILIGTHVNAQKAYKQDIGINLAGIVIKNESLVAPSLFYRLAFNNFQLRAQISMDGNLDSKTRKGNFNNGGPFGNFNQDSSINFDPGKNIRYGFLLGIQRNTEIENTNFSYYYGLDFMYMLADFSQSGKGVIAQGNGGFDTTKQRINIKLSNKSKLKSYGLGFPIGITYKFGKRFYTSLEAKFIIAYEKFNYTNLTETSQIFQSQEFITKSESSTNLKGFDFGIKPLTGLCLGMYF